MNAAPALSFLTASDYSAQGMDLNWEGMRQELWQPLRRPLRTEDLTLMPATKDWLRSMHKGMRPLALPKRYPRIANQIAQLWYDTQALFDYFEDLLVDRRGDREGFPPLVAEELRVLCGYIQNRDYQERARRSIRLFSAETGKA